MSEAVRPTNKAAPYRNWSILDPLISIRSRVGFSQSLILISRGIRCHVGSKIELDGTVNSPDLMKAKNPSQQAAHSKMLS